MHLGIWFSGWTVVHLLQFLLYLPAGDFDETVGRSWTVERSSFGTLKFLTSVPLNRRVCEHLYFSPGHQQRVGTRRLGAGAGVCVFSPSRGRERGGRKEGRVSRPGRGVLGSSTRALARALDRARRARVTSGPVCPLAEPVRKGPFPTLGCGRPRTAPLPRSWHRRLRPRPRPSRLPPPPFCVGLFHPRTFVCC